MANGVQMVTPYQSNKIVFESIMVCAENDIRSDRFSDNLSDLSCLFSFTISIWVLGAPLSVNQYFNNNKSHLNRKQVLFLRFEPSKS